MVLKSKRKRSNRIILSERDKKLRYNIAFNEKETLFNIELTTKHWNVPDFYFFITTKAEQFNYKVVRWGEDKLYLVKSITNNNRIANNKIIEEIRCAHIFVNNTVLYPFLKIINQRKLIASENKYNINKNSIIIIEPDLMTSVGFADRLRGVLSIIQICNEMGVDFFIKFNKPFRLNKYYRFKDYNSIEHLMLNNGNYYSLLLYTFPIQELKEVFLYSLKFYNIISIGTNSIFSTNKYKATFSENFKRTDILEERLSYYRKIINGEYISISLRFLNCLGDFNETDTRFMSVLDEEKQNILVKKCKKEIIEFGTTIDKKYKIVVLSDSAKFLQYISDLNNVYIFPENIMHIGNSSSQNTIINQ